MMATRIKRYRVALVTALAVIAVALLTTVPGRTAPSVSPLDVYPGFGTTDESALRDDTIALWQAYREEVHRRDCMAVLGFTYYVNASYPDEAVVAVAKSLGVQPKPSGDSPDRMNADYANSLSVTDRDTYFQSLYGESAAAMDEFHHGDGEEPHPGFARGGCAGDAAAVTDNVWSTRRALFPDLVEVWHAIAADIAAQYRDCTNGQADSPGDLESAVDNYEVGSPERTTISETLDRCGPTWQSAHAQAAPQRESAFIESHQAVLTATKEKYSTSVDQAREDVGFREYLADAAARSANQAAKDEQPPK